MRERGRFGTLTLTSIEAEFESREFTSTDRTFHINNETTAPSLTSI